MTETTEIKQTCRQKLLFYTTASFVLLGIFSLFSFLFLVPFVIDPAFTTIFMDFDESPALCVTVKTSRRLGVSNCSWTSCREGCTKDIYDCTQILVDYRRSPISTIEQQELTTPRNELDDIGYYNSYEEDKLSIDTNNYSQSEWFYREARLLPNVKGCGYPPTLNCSIFLKAYKEIGKNFTCYYSRVDPSMVISHLDMWQVYKNLIYAMAIPIPSFIASVVYLAVAYFKIYNEDEESQPLKENSEGIDTEGACGPETIAICNTSGRMTPTSEDFKDDLVSFGHHFKVAMVDEMSRNSFSDSAILNAPIGGKSLENSMTTSIPNICGGPTADI